jgi:chromosome segregation ATPase
MPRKLQAAARAHAAGRQLAALSPSDLGGRPAALKPLKEPVKGTSGSGLSVGAKNRVKTPTLPPIAPAPAAADAVSELTSKVEKLTRELSTETARSGRLQTALEQAEQAVAELRSKLDTSRSCTRCDALQTDQLKASARIAELEAYLQQQQQRAAAAEQENDPTTTSTHAEELEELQAQAATEKASLERRLEVLEVELQEAVAAAAVAAAAPAAATSASESEAAAAREAELRAEIESLREQSDAALAAEREDRAADLARRTKDWTAQLQELRDSLSASDAARSDAETRLQLEQAALLASETRCEELAAKVTSAEQAESASSSTEAEMGQVQEKLEKQKRISQRLRDDHATAVLTWQKNTGKQTPFFGPNLVFKTIVVPRQARDRHRED